MGTDLRGEAAVPRDGAQVLARIVGTIGAWCDAEDRLKVEPQLSVASRDLIGHQPNMWGPTVSSSSSKLEGGGGVEAAERHRCAATSSLPSDSSRGEESGERGKIVSSSSAPTKMKSKIKKMEKWLWLCGPYWHFNNRGFRIAFQCFENG